MGIHMNTTTMSTNQPNYILEANSIHPIIQKKSQYLRGDSSVPNGREWKEYWKFYLAFLVLRDDAEPVPVDEQIAVPERPALRPGRNTYTNTTELISARRR
jgi:hypothetical protein